MPLYYDNKQIIPAPFVNISKEYERSADGKKLCPTFTLTLTGTMVTWRGSPASVDGSGASWNGQFWTDTGYPPDESISDSGRLTALIRKQEALRELFSIDGRSFEIQGFDGQAPLKCNPRVQSVEFAEDIWYDRIEYTVVLEADILYINGSTEGEDICDPRIRDATESWSIEEGEHPGTFNFSHEISAVGKLFYDSTGSIEKEAWEQARDYVIPRLGIDSTKVDSVVMGTLPSGTYTGYNHARSDNTDEKGGSYAVTETWILTSGEMALENYTVTVRESKAEESTTSVNIEGNIAGLYSSLHDHSKKIDNAETKWAQIRGILFSRASAYASGVVLNVTPMVTSVARNPKTGLINYTYDYDDRPSNCVSGALSEVITVTDTFPANVFAVIPVLGRATGPVLQDICTRTEARRSLSIELVMERTDTCSFAAGLAAKPSVTDIIDAASGTIVAEGSIFKEQDQETWSWKSGRYNRQVTWVFNSP